MLNLTSRLFSGRGNQRREENRTKCGAYSCSYIVNKVIYLFSIPSHFFDFGIGIIVGKYTGMYVVFDGLLFEFGRSENR